jgi:hypothetical protein
MKTVTHKIAVPAAYIISVWNQPVIVYCKIYFLFFNPTFVGIAVLDV